MCARFKTITSKCEPNSVRCIVYTIALVSRSLRPMALMQIMAFVGSKALRRLGMSRRNMFDWQLPKRWCPSNQYAKNAQANTTKEHGRFRNGFYRAENWNLDKDASTGAVKKLCEGKMSFVVK
jgi:hypothetical protein